MIKIAFKTLVPIIKCLKERLAFVYKNDNFQIVSSHKVEKGCIDRGVGYN